MKTFTYYAGLVVLLVLLIITSCKKKEEPFIGKWEMQTSHVDTLVNNIVMDDTTITYDPEELWIEFKDNNTGYVSQGSPSNFTWAVSGNIITVQFSGQGPLNLDYVINEPIMTWTVTTFTGNDWPKPGDHYKIVRTETAKRM
jgi:hypothetical protein